MKNHIVLLVLAALTVTGAVLEGFFQGLPQQVVQANGLLTIIFAIAFIVWTLKTEFGSFKSKD